MDVLPDDYRVHDGEDSSPLVVVLFHLFKVGEEPGYFGRPVQEHVGDVGGEQGVQFPGVQHALQGFVRGYEFQVDIAG